MALLWWVLALEEAEAALALEEAEAALALEEAEAAACQGCDGSSGGLSRCLVASTD